MKSITFLLLIFSILTSCAKKNDHKLIVERLKYTNELKSIISKKIWKGFDAEIRATPIVYFTNNSSYVLNPTKELIEVFRLKLVYSSLGMNLYKTIKRLDNIPFHMETSNTISFQGFKEIEHPISLCSSLEETKKHVPNTNSTEYWLTMLLHENFHGFQYNHKNYLANILTKISTISEDSLAKIYSNKQWFIKSIKQENNLLLKALASKNLKETKKIITTYFVFKNKRLQKMKAVYNQDIQEIEAIYETMEGTARYVEYQLQIAFSTMSPNQSLLQSDKFYKGFKEFNNYNIQQDPWLYTCNNRYFYTTGFNILRLLDKLHIKYKSRLFKQPKLTLSELLEENS